MTNTVRGRPTSTDAVTSIEYGLIAALVSIVVIASATAMSDQLEVQFDRVETTISTPSS